MFKSITWSNYTNAVILLLVLWYGIIVLVYFRKELYNLLNGKYKIPIRKKKQQASEEEIPEDQEHTFEELERIVTDIRHSIFEEAGNNTGKDELLTQLKQRLVNYGGLRQPAFRVAINNFIIQYAESICGVAFSEDELNEAWESLPR